MAKKKTIEDFLIEISNQQKTIEYIEVYKEKRMYDEDTVNSTVEHVVELILLRRFIKECGLEKLYKKYLKGVEITGIDGDKFDFVFDDIF